MLASAYTYVCKIQFICTSFLSIAFFHWRMMGIYKKYNFSAYQWLIVYFAIQCGKTTHRKMKDHVRRNNLGYNSVCYRLFVGLGIRKADTCAYL